MTFAANPGTITVDITEGRLEHNQVTFMAGIFRSIRFGAASAHGRDPLWDKGLRRVPTPLPRTLNAPRTRIGRVLLRNDAN